MLFDREKLWRITHVPSRKYCNWRVHRNYRDRGGANFKHFYQAEAECKLRNFRDNGLSLSTNQNLDDYSRPIPMFDKAGDFVAHLNEPPFNYSFDELNEMKSIGEGSYSNLKVANPLFRVYLDRMDIASCLEYCEQRPGLDAAGFVETRVVKVLDCEDSILAIYLASGEEDVFMGDRRRILKKEIELAISRGMR